MTTSRRWVLGILGAMVVAGLAVAAVVWGRDGVEAASWLAGVASFVVAVITSLLTVPPSRGPSTALGRVQRFRAGARGDGQVFQAGNNITNAGNRPPKR